jgi:tankyrase
MSLKLVNYFICYSNKKTSFFQRVLTFNPSLVNCRDAQGRNSTPLHFAAGYNRLQVVEYLLSLGADVTARDKGGLVPLHNRY